MSAHSLAESVESNSVLKQKDFTQNGSLSATLTHKQSYGNIGQQPRFMRMLVRLIGQQFQKLTSLQEDSHAKTLAMQENELALRGVVLHSGNITVKLLGYYDQNMHLLKTSQHLLKEDSTLSLQTLPKSGMMRNGIIYQLPQLVRCTGVKDSSFLPTPTVADTFVINLKSSQQKEGSKHSMTLSHAVQKYPTPRASDSTGGYVQTVKTMSGYKSINKSGVEKGAKLQDAIRFEENLSTGQLNPNWVEWLMGFPIGWTELNALEMQSFRNARKSLRKQSKNMK